MCDRQSELSSRCRHLRYENDRCLCDGLFEVPMPEITVSPEKCTFEQCEDFDDRKENEF